MASASAFAGATANDEWQLGWKAVAFAGRLLTVKYVLGVIASILYFALVGCVSLAPMMGDCFPTAGRTCPTDAQRDHTFLMIWMIGLVIYFGLGWWLVRHTRR
jgi:hypothetical protein